MSSIASAILSPALQTSTIGSSGASSSGASAARTAIRNMLTAVQAGDLDAAKSAYVTVKGQLGGAASAAQASPIDQIGLALAAGNIEAAQGVVSSARAERSGDSTRNKDVASQARTATKAAFRGGFISLVRSLQSGDIDAATSAHDTLRALKGSGNTVATTDGGAGAFSAMMDNLGSALAAGDMTSAQSIFSTFAQSVPAGATVDIRA